MALKRIFRSKDDVFIKLLTEQTEITVAGWKALEDYFETRQESAAQKVRDSEKQADELRRVLVDELQKTFITPMDREDIFDLSLAIDDVMDYGFSTLEEIRILEIEPDQYLARMIQLVRRSCEELSLAMTRLQRNPNVAQEHALRAKKRENQVEKVYREAIAQLFAESVDLDHLLRTLRLREVYRHVSNAADQGNIAADRIGTIVMKIT
ncbi:MAG: DUF47 family protein [Chloroflexota bacterium]|nr:DUF47 family protein [Chloroflexota bacterium]